MIVLQAQDEDRWGLRMLEPCTGVCFGMSQWTLKHENVWIRRFLRAMSFYVLTGSPGWTMGFEYEENPEQSLRDLKELRVWNPVFSFGAELVLVSLCSPSSPWNIQKREAGHSPAGVRVCANVHI